METLTLSAKLWSWLLEPAQSHPTLLRGSQSTWYYLLSIPNSSRGYGQENTLTSLSYPR